MWEKTASFKRFLVSLTSTLDPRKWPQLAMYHNTIVLVEKRSQCKISTWVEISARVSLSPCFSSVSFYKSHIIFQPFFLFNFFLNARTNQVGLNVYYCQNNFHAVVWQWYLIIVVKKIQYLTVFFHNVQIIQCIMATAREMFTLRVAKWCKEK